MSIVALYQNEQVKLMGMKQSLHNWWALQMTKAKDFFLL